jgi:hypothetical protein
MFSINNKLTVEHFEQLLLLFKDVRDERRQGPRARTVILRAGAGRAGPASHGAAHGESTGLAPGFADPLAEESETGGSDDHSSLQPGPHVHPSGGRRRTWLLSGADSPPVVATPQGQGLHPAHPGPQPLRHCLPVRQGPLQPGAIHRHGHADALPGSGLLRAQRAPEAPAGTWCTSCSNLWSHRRAQRAARQKSANASRTCCARESQRLLRDDPELERHPAPRGPSPLQRHGQGRPVVQLCQPGGQPGDRPCGQAS